MPIERCAALHAAQRADELMATGDMEGRAVWHRIERAIDELQRTAPGANPTSILWWGMTPCSCCRVRGVQSNLLWWFGSSGDGIALYGRLRAGPQGTRRGRRVVRGPPWRSLQDLIGTLNELRAKNVDLYLHKQGLDTSTPAGKAMFQMLAVFAEFEREIIAERIHAGLARAREQGTKSGKPIGRPPTSCSKASPS